MQLTPLKVNLAAPSAADKLSWLKIFLSNLEKFTYIPNPGNAGDALISYASFKLFDTLKLKYDIGQAEQVYKNTILVYGGGGNLIGNLYSEARQFIQNNLAHNQIIILPHTIHQVVELPAWLATGRLRLFCRDYYTFNNVSHQSHSNKVFLAEDLAFFLEPHFFQHYKSQIKFENANIFRQDAEATDLAIPEDNLDISKSWVGSLWHNRRLCGAVVGSLAAYIAPYHQISTNRLHIAILAGLMGKQVRLRANSYFKNQAIYEYSIRGRWPHVSFCNKEGQSHG